MSLANLASQIDTPMNFIDDTANPTTVEPPNFATEVVATVVAKTFNLNGEYSQLVSERTHSITEVGVNGCADECMTLRVCQMAIFAVLSIPPWADFTVSALLAFSIVTRLAQCLEMS